MATIQCQQESAIWGVAKGETVLMNDLQSGEAQPLEETESVLPGARGGPLTQKKWAVGFGLICVAVSDHCLGQSGKNVFLR